MNKPMKPLRNGHFEYRLKIVIMQLWKPKLFSKYYKRGVIEYSCSYTM